MIPQPALDLAYDCIPRALHGSVDGQTDAQAERRARAQLGRFDTPRPLSQLLANWSIRQVDARVLEPSVGGGSFVASAAYRLRRLGNIEPLSGLRGCDIDIDACRQTHQATSLPAEQITVGDFLSHVTRDGFQGELFSAVIGNPPFISVHRMSSIQRAASREFADRLGVQLDRKASLWAYFVIAGLHCLERGGRMAFILPQAALHAGYSRTLMHAAGAHFDSSMMVSLRETCFATEGTNERVILFLGDGYRGQNIAIGDAHQHAGPILIECPFVRDVERFIESNPMARQAILPKLNGHAVPHLLAARQSQVVHLESLPQSSCLGDYAEIKIGAVTGANDFFVLSEDERRSHRIPISAVIPVVARWPKYVGLRFSLPHWKSMRDAGERCWLLYPNEFEVRKTVLDYLGQMPQADIRKNRTFQKREFWYRTVLPDAPHAFVRYMGARGPQVVSVTTPCHITNSLHALYFKARVNALQRRAVILSCLSSITLLSAEFEGRSYGSDALKVEPSETKKLRILLPRKLNGQSIKELAAQAHDLLQRHLFEEATRLVDRWLYASIPELEAALPLDRVRNTLSLARDRRR